MAMAQNSGSWDSRSVRVVSQAAKAQEGLVAAMATMLAFDADADAGACVPALQQLVLAWPHRMETMRLTSYLTLRS